MIYYRYDPTAMTNRKFVDLNTGNQFFPHLANTSTGEVQAYLEERARFMMKNPIRGGTPVYFFTGIMAFDVVDIKTGLVVDKGRP